MTKSDVLAAAEREGVRFVRLWFTDILGFLKSFAISVDELETALDEGMGFDGSSVEGMARIEESDVIAKPDPSTFVVLPWHDDEHGKVARMFCDVCEPTGEPHAADPRWALRRMLARAAEKGYTFYVGPELEYFYFRSPERPEPLDSAGYFDLTPQDVASGLRRETMATLEGLGIPVEYSHHEAAPSQQEIDLRYSDALTMADRAMTYRFVVKEVALKRGIHATFMPKPIFGVNGSGMHVHQSLFKGERNAFFDAKDAYHLSATAKHYIAGLLRHAREITVVTSQWVNSYKRLVPGYEAPVYICWGQKNRSALVRVPRYKPGKERATRAEMRSPDPACNPYLAFSVMLAAGLAGIEGKYDLPLPAERDVYHLTAEERRDLGIGELPGSLFEALQCAERSDLVREALGDHIFESFLANKRLEWDRYRTHVSQFELDAYLGVL
ncbi:MAG: glutamine synthetase [Planctomycetes bacterium]|nr:glutamine synthetase [Planctomycetota bacterium]